MQYPDMIDQARNSGHEIITIPENLKLKVQDSKDLSGNPIVDIGQFILNYNDSFTFNFVDPEQLNDKEKAIYQYTQEIIDIFGGKPKKSKK